MMHGAYNVKLCPENRTFIKTYFMKTCFMKTCVCMWYMAEFSLEWEMIQTEVVKKFKTQFYIQ